MANAVPRWGEMIFRNATCRMHGGQLIIELSNILGKPYHVCFLADGFAAEAALGGIGDISDLYGVSNGQVPDKRQARRIQGQVRMEAKIDFICL